MKNRILILLLAGMTMGAARAHAQLLVPMDNGQANHLKAYGLTYWVLDRKLTAEWLLNYRSGAFLLPDRADIRREATLRGVTFEPLTGGQLAQIRSTVAESNMEAVILEKAPKIAVYTPENVNPWDDAVTLALTYADVPYDKIWDREVLQGRLKNYDWLHLHHEDFTGQYSKFYINYAGAPWLAEAVQINNTIAQEFGLPNVPAEKKSVADDI